MKAFYSMKSKKYLLFINIWMIASVLVLISIFYSSIVYKMQEMTYENENKHNIQELNQIKNNIDYMHSVVRNMCESLYLNTDVQSIMYAYNEDQIYDFVRRMNKIKSFAEANSFIHSISVYNNRMGQFYSSYESIVFEDRTLIGLFESQEMIPRFKLVPRNIYRDASEDDYDSVFSFIMYDAVDALGKPEGAIIINIETKWLHDSINRINDVEAKGMGHILIVRSDGGLIDSDGFNESTPDVLSELDLIQADSDTATLQEVTAKANDENFYITSIPVGNEDWHIVKVQSYEDIFGYVKEIRASILAISALLLVFSVAVSIFISQRIYGPVKRLMKEVIDKKHIDYPLQNGDEFTLLRDVMDSSENEIDMYKEEMVSSKRIMKTYYLRRLLLDSASLSESEWSEIEKKGEVNLDFSEGFRICILKIDDYQQFCISNTNTDRDLYKFGIINIGLEIMREYCAAEAIDMKSDFVAVVFNAHHMQENQINGLLRQTQEAVKEYLGISITAAVSDEVREKYDISQCYYDTLNMSQYRYITGKMSMINSDVVANRSETGAVNQIFDYENRLKEAVRLGKQDMIHDVIQEATDAISKMNFNHMKLAVTYLVDVIIGTINEINQMKLESTDSRYGTMGQQVMELETIEEVKAEILSLVSEAISSSAENTNSKHAVIVEAIKDIILNNYQDSELYQQGIASMLKMSSAHIGRVFKSNTGQTINEYITAVRLTKATYLLTNSELCIMDIMLKVGIENKSYFYKLFKKHYGTTPREYALKHTLKSI